MLHAMILDGFFANRLERPIANVERQLGGGDVAIGEGTKNVWCKVKPRGGSRHRPPLARVHRLVTFPISFAELGASSFDVGRKWSLAHTVENIIEVSLIKKLDASLTKLQEVRNDCPELSFSEDDPRPDAQLLRGASQDPPDIALVALEQQQLDQTAGLGPPVQLGRKDTGVVEN